MPFYKFCDSGGRQGMAEGNLRFGSLLKFRLAELYSGPGFGDIREGTATTSIDHADLTDPKHSKTRSDLENSGFLSIENGEKVVVRNLNHHDFLNGFAFCFAEGSYGSLESYFSKEFKYENCIRIHNMPLLRKKILNANFLDRPVRDQFRLFVKKIKYTWDISKGPGIEKGDPFRKRPEFSMQREHRMLLSPISPSFDHLTDFVDIHIPDANECYSIIHQSDFDTDHKHNHTSHIDAKENFRALISEIIVFHNNNHRDEIEIGTLSKAATPESPVHTKYYWKTVEAYKELSRYSRDLDVELALCSFSPLDRWIAPLKAFSDRLASQD